MSDIIRRIERKLGVEKIASLLGDELDPSDLQSLMLEVSKKVAARRNPKTVLADYRSNRFCQPATADPLQLMEWDRIALSNLPANFQSLELSPLCPLATVSTLTPISQDWVVTTTRNTEVLSDPTNVLALECAIRRQQLARAERSRESTVNLAATQRTVRSQKMGSPMMKAHFRLFSLCSAGRDTGNLKFETAAFSAHIGFYLKCLRRYLGETVPLRVAIFDLEKHESFKTKILSTMVEGLKIVTGHLTVELSNKPEKAKGYYGQARFHLYATSPSQGEIELADGGDTDWTQRLLGNAKERLVISGIGTERLCENFKTAEASSQ